MHGNLAFNWQTDNKSHTNRGSTQHNQIKTNINRSEKVNIFIITTETRKNPFFMIFLKKGEKPI